MLSITRVSYKYKIQNIPKHSHVFVNKSWLHTSQNLALFPLSVKKQKNKEIKLVLIYRLKIIAYLDFILIFIIDSYFQFGTVDMPIYGQCTTYGQYDF